MTQSLLLLVALVCALVFAHVSATPLDDYVWADDGAYSWVDLGDEYVLHGKLGGRSWTGYTLNMTSQRWCVF